MVPPVLSPILKLVVLSAMSVLPDPALPSFKETIKKWVLGVNMGYERFFD